MVGFWGMEDVTCAIRVGPVDGQPQSCIRQGWALKAWVASVNIKHKGSDAQCIKHTIRNMNDIQDQRHSKARRS